MKDSVEKYTTSPTSIIAQNVYLELIKSSHLISFKERVQKAIFTTIKNHVLVC